MLTIPAVLASENYKVASRWNVTSGVLLINTRLSNGRIVPGRGGCTWNGKSDWFWGTY